MSNEASKYTKSATVERAREMLKRLHDRNQRIWDDLDRDVAFAIEALIASAERYRFIAHGMQAEQAQPVAWAKKAMELASDLSIESLRLGSYERKDTYENSGRASWQTVDIRQKREDARERLRQHIYTAPPQRQPLPPQSPCEMTPAERKMFRLGWLECEAAHGIRSNDAA